MQVNKLPTVKSLQVEFTELLSAKKTAYADLKKVRDEMRELSIHKANYEELRTLRNARIAKNKSVAVNNGHALIALAHEMWQCAAADKICVKGVRGCFPDKVFLRFPCAAEIVRKRIKDP